MGEEEAAAGGGVLTTSGMPVRVEVEGSIIGDGFGADVGGVINAIMMT